MRDPARGPALANLSTLDRIIRILVGVLMLAGGWWLAGESIWKTCLEVFGWLPLATGALGWDPVYSILGIRSRR